MTVKITATLTGAAFGQTKITVTGFNQGTYTVRGYRQTVTAHLESLVQAVTDARATGADVTLAIVSHGPLMIVHGWSDLRRDQAPKPGGDPRRHVQSLTGDMIHDRRRHVHSHPHLPAR